MAIDQHTFKGASEEIKGLKKSVGAEVGEEVFTKWLARDRLCFVIVLVHGDAIIT